MCQKAHKNAEFPVSKYLNELMKTSPSEVFRGDLVERFKTNLNEIESRKTELEAILLNGADRVKEHCIELRLDVDLATETAIEEIRQHRDTILKQIDDYEAKTVALIQTGEKARSEFESSIKSMDEFAKEWKSYLMKAKIDEKEVAEKNEAALELISKAEEEKWKLNSFVFNKEIILFVKNDKSVEMGNIGVVKYRHVASLDLEDLKHIDIKDIVNGGKRVQVYPQDDRTYCLLFVDSTWSVLTRVIMDSDKKIISPTKTFTSNSTSYPIYPFVKHKNNIFVNNFSGSYFLVKLNLDLSVVKSINIGNNISFLSANDAHVYTYYLNQLYVYNNELQLLKQVGQSNNPKGAFYLPTDIKQFESYKGMYYWLNNTNLQILREDDGQLVKSVAVTANNFIIDCSDNVVLINNASKELNDFTADGTLVDQIPLDNYTTDLRLSITIDGGFSFNSDTSLYSFMYTIDEA